MRARKLGVSAPLAHWLAPLTVRLPLLNGQVFAHVVGARLTLRAAERGVGATAIVDGDHRRAVALVHALPTTSSPECKQKKTHLALGSARLASFARLFAVAAAAKAAVGTAHAAGLQRDEHTRTQQDKLTAPSAAQSLKGRSTQRPFSHDWLDVQ